LHKKIEHWLRAPVFPDDDEKTRKASLLNAAGLITLIFFSFFIPILWLSKKTELSVIAIDMIGFIVILTMHSLLRKGQVVLPGGGYLVFVFTWITMVVAAQGTIRTPTTAAYLFIVILAGLLFEWNGIVVSVVASSLAVLGFILAENAGWLPKPNYAVSVVQWLLYTALFGITGGVSFYNIQSAHKALERAKKEIARRELVEKELFHLSTHDTLTGIFNRTFFEAELARYEPSRDYPMSIIIADLDNMKQTNDTLGHSVGDKLLKCVAQVLTSTFRSEDIIARIGGDEFAALLPNTDATTTEKMLARVQTQLAEHNTRHPELPVYLSLGACSAEQGHLSDAFILADQRMYSNKAVHKSNPK